MLHNLYWWYTFEPTASRYSMMEHGIEKVLTYLLPLLGILRKEDVRATDIDRVEIYKNYRPNDIILAKVIPQIEIHTYSLTTAENELGVVIASARGLATSSNTFVPVPMVPISWSEMQCPSTLIKEPRKVAKIMSENTLVSQQ